MSKQAGDTRVYATLAILIGLLAGLVVIWLWPQTDGVDQSAERVVAAPELQPIEGTVESAAPPLIEPEQTVAATADETPTAVEVEQDSLPQLQESDGEVLEAASELDEFQSLAALLIPDKVLLKGVRAVIALADGDVVKDHRPINSPAPEFKVIVIDETLDPDVGQRFNIDPANYQRYERYINALARMDVDKAVAIYQRFYPLLEEAYGQYGINQGSFHSILIKAIDEVLSTRVPPPDAALVSPNAFYRFHDKTYEGFAPSGKLLWRIGPENTAALRSALLPLREKLDDLSMPAS